MLLPAGRTGVPHPAGDGLEPSHPVGRRLAVLVVVAVADHPGAQWQAVDDVVGGDAGVADAVGEGLQRPEVPFPGVVVW